MAALEKDEHPEFKLIVSRNTRRALFSGKTDEPALGAEPVTRRRGSGLAKNIKRQFTEFRPLRRTVFHRPAHPLDQYRALLRRNLQPRHLLFDYDPIAAILRALQVAAIYQCRIGRNQLNGRDKQLFAFPQSISHVPFPVRQSPGGFVRTGAGSRTEAETAEHRIE